MTDNTDTQNPKKKILKIDMPVFIMVNEDIDPIHVAGEFEAGAESALCGFNGFGSYEPEVLNAGVKEVSVASQADLDDCGITVPDSVDIVFE